MHLLSTVLLCKIGEHDTQLAQIYDSIEHLLDEKAAQKNWEDRPRIGFAKGLGLD